MTFPSLLNRQLEQFIYITSPASLPFRPSLSNTNNKSPKSKSPKSSQYSHRSNHLFNVSQAASLVAAILFRLSSMGCIYDIWEMSRCNKCKYDSLACSAWRSQLSDDATMIRNNDAKRLSVVHTSTSMTSLNLILFPSLCLPCPISLPAVLLLFCFSPFLSLNLCPFPPSFRFSLCFAMLFELIGIPYQFVNH